MVKIEIDYRGALLCEAKHGPSGKCCITDAPSDIGGGASSFSPTDLVATALGTCIATTMDMVAKRHGWNIAGTRIEVSKEMTAVPPRRIKRLATHVTMPISRAIDPNGLLERAAHKCPVHQSLHPDIELPIVFYWKD